MFLHIESVIIGASLLYGFLNKILFTGGSVARASAANVSIIRFTQSIQTAFRGDSFKITEPIKTINIATTLTVNQNYINFLTFSYTFLPYLIATMIEEKLSSSNMISEAHLAISVPDKFIEKPTSAFVNAGASFVPSPVTATTSFVF